MAEQIFLSDVLYQSSGAGEDVFVGTSLFNEELAVTGSSKFYQFGKWSDNDASSVTTLHPFGNYYTPEPPVPRKFLFKLHTV